MLTISGLPRASECPGSAALPHANTTSSDAEAGIDNHAAAETAVRTGDLDKLPPELRELITPGSVVRPEYAVAYDIATDTARALNIGDREYDAASPPLTDDEVPGTLDLLIISPDTLREVDGMSTVVTHLLRVTVVDYKLHTDVGSPDENEQLLGYALAAARLTGATEVTVVVAYIEADEHGFVRLMRPLVVREVDAIDLDAFASKLRRIVEAVRVQRARAVPDVSESKQCRHCPALVHCPAKRALLVRITSGQERDELEAMIPLTPQTVAVAYERWKQADHLLKRIRAAIFAFAGEVDVPLGDGRVLGRRTKLGNTTLDGDTVYEVVREKYGQEVADKAVTRDSTQSRLEIVLKANNVKPLAPALREVMAEVHKRGGSKREPKETTDVHALELPERAVG